MNILTKILCKTLKWIEELIMNLKPSICGTNEISIPSGCEYVGSFIGANDITILQGDVFDPTYGVTAVDADGNEIPYDVSPTSIDTCEVGTHQFTYSTELFSKTRTVFVAQATAPAISGMSSVTVNVGDPFDTMNGVSATDAHGRAVSVACTEGNPITYNTAGTYTLHYTATDVCGNVGTATRTITAALGHFVGITNETLNQGIDFDLTDGVTAVKGDGTEVPFTVTPSPYAKCDVGEQTYTYTASGVETATRTITVLAIADPTISGATETINVKKNEEFDPLEGVTAVDGNGNTITVTVELEP